MARTRFNSTYRQDARLIQSSSVAVTPTVTVTKGAIDGTTTVNTVNVGAGTGGIVQNGNGTTGTLTIV